MVRKRVSDKEEILELRKEVAELKRQIAVLPQTHAEGLSEREKAVLECVDNNPGTSKQDVINKLTLESKGSRVTVHNAIRDLEGYGMIYARKDKPNSQIYRLYVNEDSIFLSVYRELENFKNAFFVLIEKTKMRLVKKNVPWIFNKSNDSDAFYDLLLIYHHVLGIYLSYSVLKWPAEVIDQAILTKIYAIIIYQMVQIQTKMSESFRIQGKMPSFNHATYGQVLSPILQRFIDRMFLLQPRTIIKILDDYKRYKYNIREEVVPVLKTVWEIGFPIYLYTDPYIDLLPQHRDKLRDWRLAVAYYLHRNKDKIHVDKEIWNMLGHPPES
jgi:hypothetical protein